LYINKLKTQIDDVVVRGLVELYKTSPKKPLTYLALWILQESKSKEIKQKVNNKGDAI